MANDAVKLPASPVLLVGGLCCLHDLAMQPAQRQSALQLTASVGHLPVANRDILVLG